MDKAWRTEGTVSKNNWKVTSSLTHMLHHHIFFFSCRLILAPSRLFVFDASLRPVTPEKWEMTLCIRLRFEPSRLILNLGFSNDFIKENQ